jgi:hypothetical protein
VTELTSTASFIISELEKHDIDADMTFTGGGCTAVTCMIEHSDPDVETAYILITDVTGTTCNIPETEWSRFLGWVVGYYASEDALAAGEDARWLRSDAYLRETAIAKARKDFGVERGQRMAQNMYVDWRNDATCAADAIAFFLKNELGR